MNRWTDVALDAEVLLPINEEELESFFKEIIARYDLPLGEETEDAIATMVLHLPQSKSHVPLCYFGHSVLKSLANQVAFKKLKELKEKRDLKEKAEKIKLELVSNENKDVESDCGQQSI